MTKEDFVVVVMEAWLSGVLATAGVVVLCVGITFGSLIVGGLLFLMFVSASFWLGCRVDRYVLAFSNQSIRR